ncbi:MAG: undecaprenyl diphosphate synthase [Petroclostridium sp.]|uniref:polyprenyl diphosphate synthase n=1 Tax=Petroclostridium xylanilyticum TaxID=1792311 RepID=UPI000B999CF5|nr:polyprenyl diphosphate synthase [Petroclostridium xylanilyticum]MDK2809639.1 undecaprenyl diphosphate synthase [Petroclostridium sp.]
MRIPNHIGIIPDGNRRWAEQNGLSKEQGYEKGLYPGLKLFRLCKEVGVKEVTFYGFTQDNTKRPSVQVQAFQKACVDAVKILAQEDADLLVIGNTESPMFPKELLPYTQRTKIGKGRIKLNFLVNYGWEWDLSRVRQQAEENLPTSKQLLKYLHSSDVSRIDLIIRWGGRRRLSGLLPVQSVYADFYVIDDYWPDFKEQHFYDALQWYQQQDITLGG